MPLSRYLVAFLWLYLGIVLVAHQRLGGSANVNGLTVTLMVLLVLALIRLARAPAGRLARAYNLRLVIYLGMFVLLPLVGYLLYPERLPFVRPALDHGARSVNQALLLFLLGTLALVFGFSNGVAGVPEGTAPSEQDQAAPAPPALSRAWLAMTLLGFLVIDVLIQARFGYKYVGTGITQGQYWTRFLSFAPLAFLGTVYVLEHHARLPLVEKALIIGSVLAWQFSRVLFGSRSSLITFALLILGYYLVRDGDPRISRRVGFAGGALVAVAVLTYPVGLAMRAFRAASLEGLVSFDVSTIFAFLPLVYETGWQELLPSIMARLGGLDAVTTIMDGPVVDPQPYIGLGHDLKALINILLPGEPFPGVMDSSSTFPIVYMGYELSYFLEFQKLTMPWLIWGLCFVYFGWLLVIPALALVGWLSGRAMRWAATRLPPAIRRYGEVWMLVWLFLLVENLGLDFWLASIVYDILPYLVVAPFLYLSIRRPRQIAGQAPVMAAAP